MMYLRCMFNGGIEDKHGGPNRNGEDDATFIETLSPKVCVKKWENLACSIGDQLILVFSPCERFDIQLWRELAQGSKK